MKAQKLYNLREEFEFCSGTDLHEFFYRQTSDPSPSGKVEINTESALEFIDRMTAQMEANSPSLAEHCQLTRQAARNA